MIEDSDQEPVQDEPVDAEALSRSLDEMPQWEVDEINPEDIAVEPEEVALEPVEEEPSESMGSLTPAEAEQPPPLIRILEAMLFVGDAPLTEPRACGTIRGLTPEDFHQAISELTKQYRAQGRPYYIKVVNHGYVLELRSRFSKVREKLYGTVREARLSPPAIEVLALVAYQQPVTRPEIDSLRGADSAKLLRQLVRHGLVSLQKEKGATEPVYVTTSGFLELFQLSDLNDLPQTRELRLI